MATYKTFNSQISQSFNSETTPFWDNERRTYGIVTKGDIHRIPHIMYIIVVFFCGITSIVLGGIENTFEDADLVIAIMIQINIWVGAMVSSNSLLFHHK